MTRAEPRGRNRMLVLALGLVLLAGLVSAAGADAARKLSINDVSVGESDGLATFTLSLSRKARRTVSVDYATADGTAAQPGDYIDTAGTAKIKRRKKKATVSVPIVGDEDAEEDEAFTVRLTNPHRAGIKDNEGTGMILDDDGPEGPELTGFEAGCVSVGAVNAVAGSVTLSAAAEADTFVSITSGSPSKATITGSGATIPTGQTTVSFQASGLEEGTSTLTASLNGVDLTDDLEVADPCPADVAVLNETDQGAEADFCRLVFPTTLTADAGEATDPVFGQIFESGVTEAAGAASGVTAEFGYGPSGTDPRTNFTWQFFDAAYNVQVGNNDEYMQSITAPAPGTYAYVYRFSFDGGHSVTYCDADVTGAGSNSGLTFDPAQMGTMTVSAR